MRTGLFYYLCRDKRLFTPQRGAESFIVSKVYRLARSDCGRFPYMAANTKTRTPPPLDALRGGGMNL